MCVIEPMDSILERLRLEHDPTAIVGVPAHVTCLSPFVPPRLLDAEVLGAVGDVAAAFEGFTVLFPDVREFPGVVWLRPDPADRFRALTGALVAAFPDYPPYRGRFPDPSPT